MKKVLTFLALIVLTINFSFASYSSQTAEDLNTSKNLSISEVIKSNDFTSKSIDFKSKFDNFKSKITTKVKQAKGNFINKIKETKVAIHRYIIIGLVCLLLGAVVSMIPALSVIGWIIAVIGLVLIILGLITYL